ncbi:10491_t:CDS:2 [Gigaspora rosea]|nr:10491_t:CDS:2 [Gigaspora rosea]
MTSTFCAISFIKNVSGSSKCCSGTAVYRTSINDYVEFRYKAFRFGENTLVKEITQSSISLIVGRFAFVKTELHVMVEQHTPLNIQTMAHVQDESTAEGDTASFRLKRDAYDGVTSSQVTMSILCRYDPKGRHKNVSDATKHKPIFSVAGELITLKKSMCIDCDIRCTRKIGRKFDKSLNKTSTQKDSTETEKETHQEQDRAKRLRTAMNEVRADLNTNDEHSDTPNNPIEHNRTGEPSNDQSPPRFENSTGDPHLDEEAESIRDAEMHDNTDSP